MFPGPARHKRPSRPPSAAVNAAGAAVNGRSRRPPPAPGHPPVPTAGPGSWAVAFRGCPLSLLPPTPPAEPGGTGRGGKPGLLAARCPKGSPGRACRRPAGCPAPAAAGAGKLSAGPVRHRGPAGDLRLHTGPGGTAAGPPRRQLRQRGCKCPGSRAGPGEGAGEAAFGNKAPAQRGGVGRKSSLSFPGAEYFVNSGERDSSPQAPVRGGEKTGWVGGGEGSADLPGVKH